MSDRNRLEERNLSHERGRRSGGSGLLSTIATVVILAGAGMAGASQSNGGRVADQAKTAITGSSHAPSADAVGSGHVAGGDEGTGVSTNGGTSVDPGAGDGPGTGDHGTGAGAGRAPIPAAARAPATQPQTGNGHSHETGTGHGPGDRNGPRPRNRNRR